MLNIAASKKLFIISPLVLILLSFLLEFYQQSTASHEKYNAYLEELPANYVELLNQNIDSKSNYSLSVREENGIRELIIFELFPKSFKVNTKFSVEVYPAKEGVVDNTKAFFNYDITANASVYRHEQKSYALFRKALPFFDIEKIIVKEKSHYNTPKEKDRWSIELSNPFKTVEKPKVTGYNSKRNQLLHHPSPYCSLMEQLLNDKGIQYIPSMLVVKGDSLFQAQDRLATYLSNQSLSVASIQQANLFWTAIEKKDSLLIDKMDWSGENQDGLKQALSSYLTGKASLSETFDLDQFAQYLTIKHLFSNACVDPLHLVFDQEKKLLAPLFVNSNCLGSLSQSLSKPPLSDLSFVNPYVQALNEISESDLYKELLNEHAEFEQELALINQYDPNAVFNMDVLTANQKVIGKSLNPSTAIKVELISINNQKVEFSVSNYCNYPVLIEGLNHLTKKNIVSLDVEDQFLILPNASDTVSIVLPRSFENLFVSKKTKQTGFILHKHFDELFLEYQVLGTSKKNFSEIIPYEPLQRMSENIMRKNSTLDAHKDLVIDETKKQIRFNKKEIQIGAPLVVPANYTFTIDPGTSIDILENGMIISYAPLLFEGTETNPIRFNSSDLKGQGLLVLSEKRESKLSYVEFSNLANPNKGPWNVSGAVSFYESPVTLDHVSISSNRCEDALNIIRTKFLMMNSKIEKTQSDAFDGDFVTGTIKNCSFYQLGNDAIDVSGSSLKLENIEIEDAGDKGLSAGENSTMKGKNISITKSEIAVAGKDLSLVDIQSVKVSDTKLAFTAFQKKSEFGPSDIVVDGLETEGVALNHLIEVRSSLTIDGEKVEVSENVKDRMYGVEFGVSSDETRIVN